jgi:obg-like ATPase 1
MHFEDFKAEGSEVSCKAAGKYRQQVSSFYSCNVFAHFMGAFFQQGRNYTVLDGDIIFFKFNAGAGLKDPKKK